MQLSSDQQNALLRLNYASTITADLNDTLMRSLDEWDSAMYLAACVQLMGTMQQWMCNVGASEEFRRWLGEEIGTDIAKRGETFDEDYLSPDSRCVALLIDASKEEVAHHEDNQA